MATQLLKTVKPSGGDYTSLEACMHANEQNLVTADKYFDVEVDGSWSSADTTACTIHNYTTDATRYINIYTTAAARHHGIWSADHYRLTPATNSSGVACSHDHTSVTGIQVKIVENNNYTKGGIAGCSSVISCIVWSEKDYTSYCLQYMRTGGTGGRFFNNVCYDAKTYGIMAEKGTAHLAYNNTVYNCGAGIRFDNYGGTTFVLKNNIAYGNASGDYTGSPASAGSTHNLSSDATAPALGTYYRNKTLTFTNTGGGTEDLHLVSGDTDAIDKGADLSGEFFTDDIDGVTRTGTWDIGADEYVAAEAGGQPTMRRWEHVKYMPHSYSIGA